MCLRRCNSNLLLRARRCAKRCHCCIKVDSLARPAPAHAGSSVTYNHAMARHCVYIPSAQSELSRDNSGSVRTSKPALSIASCCLSCIGCQCGNGPSNSRSKGMLATSAVQHLLVVASSQSMLPRVRVVSAEACHASRPACFGVACGVWRHAPMAPVLPAL